MVVFFIYLLYNKKVFETTAWVICVFIIHYSYHLCIHVAKEEFEKITGERTSKAIVIEIHENTGTFVITSS